MYSIHRRKDGGGEDDDDDNGDDDDEGGAKAAMRWRGLVSGGSGCLRAGVAEG